VAQEFRDKEILAALEQDLQVIEVVEVVEQELLEQVKVVHLLLQVEMDFHLQ
jgi:hypothetical protein